MQLQKQGLTTSVNLGLAGFRQWVKGRSQKEPGQLTSLNVKTCGAEATKICKASSVAMLAIGFCNRKSCWGLL